MDLFSADFWNTVKEVSTAALALLVVYHMLAARAAAGRRPLSGLLGNRGLLKNRHGRLQAAWRAITAKLFGARVKDREGHCTKERPPACERPQEAILWGTDPYMLAVQMASQGMALDEIARRTEIPRGEIMLAVRFRGALENRVRAVAGPPDAGV